MISESTAFKSAAMTGRVNFLDTGASSAKLRVYGGTRPASGATPGTLLCEITLTEPAGTVNGSAQLVLTQSADGLIAATGTASWCRVVNGDGAFCFDLDASLTGGAGEAQFPNLNLLAGGGLRLVSCLIG